MMGYLRPNVKKNHDNTVFVSLQIYELKILYCLSPTCSNEVESVEHILIHCRAYTECKRRLYSLWLSSPNPVVIKLVTEAFSEEIEYLLQFIIDCSVLPHVINAVQAQGPEILDDLFYLTRTWCYSIHRYRMKMLGRWIFQ